MAVQSNSRNRWLSGALFTGAGGLLYIGCRAAGQEIARKGLFSMTQSDFRTVIMLGLGIDAGIAGLVLGGGLVAAALVIGLSGKSPGRNAVTSIAKYVLIGSVVTYLVIMAFLLSDMGNSADLFRPRQGPDLTKLLDIVPYTYIGGVVLLFLGLINGKKEISSEQPTAEV